MPSPIRLASMAYIVVCLIALPGCLFGPPPRPFPTVLGPEASDLLDRVHGNAITTTPDPSGREACWAIDVLALPSQKEHVVTPSMPYRGSAIWSLSGPDRAGRIAFVQNTPPKDQVNLVKIINLDGTGERVVARVPAAAVGGGHPWLHPGIGRHLALSPVAGHIAFIRDLSDAEMPEAFCTVGTLDIRDVETGESLHTVAGIRHSGLSWFPDGRRLAYVAFLPREEALTPTESDALDTCKGWSRLPVVVTFSLETGKSEVIGPGEYPVVSDDGRKILYDDLRGGLRAFDVATGNTSKVELPGRCGGVLAILPDGLTVYQSRPTEGQPVERSWGGSFKSGTQMLPIKVCDPATGRFQTLGGAIDPRHPISFGGAK